MSDTGQTSLFGSAFQTLKRLPIEGFDYNSLSQRFKMMTLLLGEDYPMVVREREPLADKYSPALTRKLRLLGGPHGATWAALRLREQGYRLSGGVWCKGAQDG